MKDTKHCIYIYFETMNKQNGINAYIFVLHDGDRLTFAAAIFIAPELFRKTSTPELSNVRNPFTLW